MHGILILDFFVLTGKVCEWVRAEQAGIRMFLLRLFGTCHLIIPRLRLVDAQRLRDPVKLGLLIVVADGTAHHVLLLVVIVVLTTHCRHGVFAA